MISIAGLAWWGGTEADAAEALAAGGDLASMRVTIRLWELAAEAWARVGGDAVAARSVLAQAIQNRGAGKHSALSLEFSRLVTLHAHELSLELSDTAVGIAREPSPLPCELRLPVTVPVARPALSRTDRRAHNAAHFLDIAEIAASPSPSPPPSTSRSSPVPCYFWEGEADVDKRDLDDALASLNDEVRKSPVFSHLTLQNKALATSPSSPSAFSRTIGHSRSRLHALISNASLSSTKI